MVARALKWLCIALLSSSCTNVDYGKLSPGRFSGSLFVMWVSEGGNSGDGRFLFVPDRANPLTFYRSERSLPGAVVRPGLMYTDGGSIPKLAQAFRGFSPWGYAPAYMIHDWLFTARYCLTDGDPDPIYDPLRNVSFEDSAAILGEAIQTLIAEARIQANDVASTVITAAVASPVAQNLWDQRGVCEKLKVDPVHARAATEAQLGPRPGRLRSPSAVNARVITRVSF